MGGADFCPLHPFRCHQLRPLPLPRNQCQQLRGPSDLRLRESPASTSSAGIPPLARPGFPPNPPSDPGPIRSTDASEVEGKTHQAPTSRASFFGAIMQYDSITWGRSSSAVRPVRTTPTTPSHPRKAGRRSDRRASGLDAPVPRAGRSARGMLSLRRGDYRHSRTSRKSSF